jgi:histidine decarboxylase
VDVVTPVEPAPGTDGAVATLRDRLDRARERCIGFPVARDIDFSPNSALHVGLINNIGDPERPGRWPSHTHDVEVDLVAYFAEHFGGTRRTTWGYVSGGGSSEGVLHGMWLGREHQPGARVYHSGAAHYCVAKAARLLGLKEVSVVAADPGGAMDLDALASAVHPHRDRPVLLVATLGTTMTEAVDDLPGIHSVLDAAGVPGRHVVVDAALSGPGLAVEGGPATELLTPRDVDGSGTTVVASGWADGVCFSTHKSFGTPHVGGVVLTRREHVARVARPVDYVASLDVTVGGSRSGQTAVELAHALDSIGGPDRQIDRFRARVCAAREVAEHAVMALRAIGWPAWRHPHAWTVVLDAVPPDTVVFRWGLPVSEGRAHLVCAPGVDRTLVDAFVADLPTRRILENSA